MECKELLSKLGADMRSILRSTLNDGRERGFFIMDKGGGFEGGPIAVGSNTGVMLRFPNQGSLSSEPDYSSIVGSVHTHPKSRYDEVFSMQDINSLIAGGLEFSAMIHTSTTGNYVSIYTPSGYSSVDRLYNSVSYNHGGFESRLDMIRGLNSELLNCTHRLR